MTALELIKSGILNNDISLVAQGYKLMTGEDLLSNKKLILPQNEHTEQEENAQVDEYDVSNFVMSQNINQTQTVREDGKIAAKKEPINIQKIKMVSNLFADDKTLATDVGLTEKQKTIPPVARNRPKPKIVTTECVGGCNRKFQILAGLIPNGGYKCPKCIRRLTGN